MDQNAEHRQFLKDSLRKTIDFRKSPQSSGAPMPHFEKAIPKDQPRISLPTRKDWQEITGKHNMVDIFGRRKSRRNFNDTPLSVEELSFLLWATQGLRDSTRAQPQYRTVPSAGARHSFETYLFIDKVETIPPGLYRFLPLSNELTLIYEWYPGLSKEISNSAFGQKFVANCAATFVWTTIPYRMEWRYLASAHRVILLDAGHVCQNLYLACESLALGTCAIAAYDQEAMDNLLRVDGEDEFTIYLAPVGRY